MKRLLLFFALMLTVGINAWAGGDWTIIEQPTCSKYGTMQNPANTSELRLVPKLAHHFVNGKCTVCSHAAPTKYNGTPATSLVTITESNYATYGLTEKNKDCVMGWTVITTAEEFMRYINNDGEDFHWIEFNAFLAEDIILDEKVNLPERELYEEYVFDGTGHTISNVYRSGDSSVGLFEENKGTIRNLGLISPKIVVSNYYGGCICGFNSGVIENCFVIDGYIGGADSSLYGIASQSENVNIGGKIINCYAISNKGNVGNTDIGTIANSYAATTGSNDFYANTLSELNKSKVNGMTWSIDTEHSNIPYPVIMSTMMYYPATATCTEDGRKEYWYCTVCNKLFLRANHTETTPEALYSPALGHDMKYFDRVEATCSATGSIEHYHCDRCEKDFDDENGTKEIDIVIQINPNNHLMQHVDRKEATCVTTGRIEHYHCDRCLKNFEDKDGAKKIDDIEIQINPNNHKLSLKDGKAHCKWCDKDISGFVATNDKPVSLTKENDEYFLKADFVLDGGVNYLADVDFIVNGTFTYRRNVSGVQKGAWQCWYEPFEVQLDGYVLEKMDVAEVAGVLLDNEGNTVVAFRKIDSGWMKANTPYVFRPKDAILTTGNLELKTTGLELRKSEETTFYNMSTYDKFTFGGNYTARHNDSWYTLNTSGVFQKMKEDVNLKGQRFWMTIEARNDIPYEYGGIANAKESIDFTILGDDEPTGITSYENENKNESIYNLNGQKVTSIRSGQVYIMNGKKYIAQ